jgi:hypothetical protein
MPEPENGPERELGPTITEALRTKAGMARPARGDWFAGEARRRVRKRRQTLMAGAAAVVVAVAIGGVWSGVGGPPPVVTSRNDSTAEGAGDAKTGPSPMSAGPLSCPAQHPISAANSPEAVPPGTGLSLTTPVTGLQACRYRTLAQGQSGSRLLGSASFDAATAQEVVDSIARLPERNPDLPVLRCTPEAARPKEAIVLRFGTAAGAREVWVWYDGCSAAGFFTGQRAYGLYAGPLKLFMTGSVRPAGGMYLDRLPGW